MTWLNTHAAIDENNVEVLRTTVIIIELLKESIAEMAIYVHS